jgi:hypothetical protein
MILSKKSGDFKSAPEFTGRAVCVDVTEPKEMESMYGKQMKFRIVFEIDELQDEGEREGQPWCVWSMPFTMTLHEKAGLRKFLKQWFGRDLTAAELEGLDTESLIGKPASIVVTHTTKENDPTTIYANIAACVPFKGADPLKPSGHYTRSKDRDNGGTSYKKTSAPTEVSRETTKASPAGPLKVHVGKCKGVDFTDLAAAQIEKLEEHWLPSAKSNPKPSADDRRLIAAIEAWVAERDEFKSSAAKPKPEADDIPY